jgi:hypothetical protein
MGGQRAPFVQAGFESPHFLPYSRATGDLFLGEFSNRLRGDLRAATKRSSGANHETEAGLERFDHHSGSMAAHRDRFVADLPSLHRIFMISIRSRFRRAQPRSADL